MEIVPGNPVDGITQFNILFNRIPSQVQKPEFHTQVFTPVSFILYGKWGCYRFIQDGDLFYPYLNFPCWD